MKSINESFFLDLTENQKPSYDQVSSVLNESILVYKVFHRGLLEYSAAKRVYL